MSEAEASAARKRALEAEKRIQRPTIKRPAGRKPGQCWYCGAPDAKIQCCGCRIARYCRPACQVQAWNGQGNDSHARLCRQWQTEMHCWHRPCRAPGADMLCPGCLTALYCDTACSRRDLGRHEKDCLKWKEGTAVYGVNDDAAAAGVESAGGAASELLDEDTAGYEAADELQELCFSCGAFYCYACCINIGNYKVTACYACQAPFHSTAAKQIVRMQRLLLNSTPPGRHTQIIQYKLGVFMEEHYKISEYEKEKDVSKLTAAVTYLRASAQHGYAPAQHALGIKRNGIGVDMAEATKFLRLAAAQGYTPAQHTLGRLFLHRKIKSKDKVEQKQWKRWAKQKDHIE
eukprot:gene6724-14619_t